MAGISIIRAPAGCRVAVDSALEAGLPDIVLSLLAALSMRQIRWFSKYLEIVEACPSAALQSGHGNPDIPGGILEDIGLNLVRARY